MSTLTYSYAPTEPLASTAPQRSFRPNPQNPAGSSSAVTGRYLGYVLYFVGAGLISGAVVHHPLDPSRYTMIAMVGAALFVIATVINEFVLVAQRPALARALLVVGASLVLSFGIGMLSGGLQHFEDFPDRAAVLVPAGIAVSFLGFVVKDPHTSWHRIVGPVGLAVAVATVATYLVLGAVAADMTQAASPGHGHGETTPPAETPVEQAPVRAETHDSEEGHAPAGRHAPAAAEDDHGH